MGHRRSQRKHHHRLTSGAGRQHGVCVDEEVKRFAIRSTIGQFLFMTVVTKKQLKTLVAKMKPGERVELADSLYASLPNTYLASVNRAWEREIDRRLDDYEAG